MDSCDKSLNGLVLDRNTKEPIPYATVKQEGTNNYTTTGIDGKFNLAGLCDENVTLIISCIGYRDSTCSHHHDHGQSPHFYLKQSVEEIETVVIEAEREKHDGTHSISQATMEKKEIQKIPSKTLASTISGIEGVTFVSSGSNIQLPIIHGLYGNRILIINNGLKHGFQNWSVDHAPEIDVTSANSITVIKGASGVRFGPEALGGAILVESNPLYLNDPLNVNIGSSYQTNGRGYSTNFETSQGFRRWGYFLNGNYSRIGDRHSPDYVLTNSGREELSFSSGLRFHYKSFDAKVLYSYVDQNLALLRSSVAESANSFTRAINSEKPIIINPFSYDINEPNQLTEHHLAKAELSWYLNPENKITLRLGRQFNNREEYDVRRNAEKPIINLDLSTDDYQLEWKHSQFLGLEGLVGVQYFKQENRNNPGTGTTAFIPNYNSDRYSAFIAESKHFGKNVIELGVRLDNESTFIAGRETSQEIFIDDFQFSNITASIGYLRELTEHLSFRTNIGTAWRSPNMAELYSFGQHGFKSTYGLLRYYYNSVGRLRTNRVLEFDDSNVKTENGIKFINELESRKEGVHQKLTFYTHYIENFIYQRPYGVIGTIRGPMPIFIFDQSDAFFLGLDYSHKRKLSSDLTATAGISYLWSQNIEENEPLINQPPIRLSLDLEWDHGSLWKFKSSMINLRSTYTFQQFQAPRTVTPEELIEQEEIITSESEIFDFMDAPEGYIMFDLFWTIGWNNFTASVGIENMLNSSYRDYLNEMRYFADEPGRNFIFSLNYSFRAKPRINNINTN